jgi:hypothetical protein
VNNLLDKIKVNNTADKKVTNSKKIKDDYKKNLKEKGYSKSIDNNANKKVSSSNSVGGNVINVNSNTEITNRIKINKAKK